MAEHVPLLCRFRVVGLCSLYKDGSQAIDRTPQSMATFVQDLRVYHGGADLLVPEQFLERPDVVARLKEVRGERMGDVWQLVGLAIADWRADSLTAFSMTDSCKCCLCCVRVMGSVQFWEAQKTHCQPPLRPP